MHAIAIVLVFGAMMNGLTPKPASLEEYHANFRAQFESPVIVDDYSNLNK